METIQIELKNKNALSILRSLEKAQMIKLISKEAKTENAPVHFKDAPTKKRAMDIAHEIEKSREEGIAKSNKGKTRIFGYAKNAITIKPDFDEPLEDFKEYMV